MALQSSLLCFQFRPPTTCSSILFLLLSNVTPVFKQKIRYRSFREGMSDEKGDEVKDQDTEMTAKI
jgi:hypothetical protein